MDTETTKPTSPWQYFGRAKSTHELRARDRVALRIFAAVGLLVGFALPSIIIGVWMDRSVVGFLVAIPVALLAGDFAVSWYLARFARPKR